MDLVKQEIARNRRTIDENVGSGGGKRRFFKKSEIEQKRLQKLREEEKRELEEKSRRQQKDSSSSASATASLMDLIYSAKSNNDSSSKKVIVAADDKKIDELDLPKQEVVRRLRFLKQPVTLFGEDDEDRLERLKYVLKAGDFEVDSDMTEGQTNDFLRDIVELKKRQKTGMLSDRKRKSEEMEDADGGKGDGDSGDGASSGGDGDKDLKLMKAKFEDLCEEDKILVFFKRLLNEWKQELDEMLEVRRTAKGKQMFATFKQCARYLSPLFKFCRKRVLPDDIKRSLMFIVNLCMERDYITAVDHYIKLAIGNAPWPIGVTMVGIHERSAREKIYTNSVAHVMNDETTRKYLQSVKRLVTFCQRKYPTVPSKSIEFNSLANGSDLQALLMEEQYAGGGNQGSQEMLQLMPPPSDE